MQLEFRWSNWNVSLLLWHNLNYIIPLDCHNFSAQLVWAFANTADNKEENDMRGKESDLLSRFSPVDTKTFWNAAHKVQPNTELRLITNKKACSLNSQQQGIQFVHVPN